MQHEDNISSVVTENNPTPPMHMIKNPQSMKSDRSWDPEGAPATRLVAIYKCFASLVS